MKKIFAILSMLLFSVSIMAQVPIPNGDFEDNTGNYIDGWALKSGDCQAREYLLLNGPNGQVTVNPVSGERFVTLMNGGASLGKLEADFPLNARPQYFSFYCGYIPGTSSGEKFGFFLIFTKFNASKGMNDTILSVGGYLPASGQIVPWARISGSLSSYYQTDEVPDRAQITFMTDVATNAMGQIIASPYTVLALDNVEFPASLSTGGELTLRNIEEYKAYPNPFSSSTHISYTLTNNSHVKINIYNLNGKLVKKLVDKNEIRGNHLEFFNAEGLEKGIYMYRIETDVNVQSGKLIIQ
jgi:hypothetical protein